MSELVAEHHQGDGKPNGGSAVVPHQSQGAPKLAVQLVSKRQVTLAKPGSGEANSNAKRRPEAAREL